MSSTQQKSINEQLVNSLEGILSKLHASATEVVENVDPIVYGTHTEPELNVHLHLYVVLKYIKDVCEELTTMCNKSMPEVASRAEKIMSAKQIDSIRFMDNVFTPDIESYVNYTKDNEHTVLEWLKNHPVGKQLVREAVHPKTFTKFIKEHFLEKGDNVPDFISVFDKKTLGVKKSRK